MLKWMRERLSRDEGFTLIELMVVVLIIAILIAIAIPSFLGFRTNAQDRSAQADLRSVLLAEKAYFTETGVFEVTAASPNLTAIEPNINTSVTLDGTATEVCVELVSASGTFFQVWEGATDATVYGQSATALASCPTAAPTTWTAW